MRRKNVLGIVCGLCLLITTPVMADIPDIDLSSMSTEDLVTLKDSIASEIANRGGENIIGQGTYEVGVDIKATNFRVTCAEVSDDAMTFIYIYDSKEDMDKNHKSDDILLSYNVDDTGSKNSANLNLKGGQFVKIAGDGAIIEETKASWQP